ncbi:sulfotransferase domain-containing protein [Flagellimonas zhangzhouensis]|uniref:Sulfotransferase family protein n=1 Tax=Flagellimonas zhangzhouensis TaxID=1073328 RepID=A0A1H2UR16_9FLAO|nr:sulfotransferase domain-containing protein [Allomuricauda zhangzhouensis]SDQ14657.1 Sulfotransferase domain-containing protein [Allomuricauda zhangzhouensis]SDW58500.1 Sulfotransferase family protein [Allomuricauda zhangzhouensis]
MEKKSILIVGTRRAGTTFIGKLLSLSAKGLNYVEEPFNPIRGIKNLDLIWYPYLKDDDKNLKIKKDLIRLLKLKKVPFKYSIVNNQKNRVVANVSLKDVFVELFKNSSEEFFSTRFLRIFLKSNHHLSYIKARIFSNRKTVFKDALMSLSTSFILKNSTDTGIVFIFRNPVGFYHSVKRLNWEMSLENFLEQDELVKDYPFIKELPTATEADRIINEWIVINTILLDQIVNHGAKIICISHDKLSRNPKEQMEMLFQKLEFSEKADLETITSFTQGNHKSKKTKDVKRNSKNEINSWQNKLSEKEVEFINSRTNALYKQLNKIAI